MTSIPREYSPESSDADHAREPAEWGHKALPVVIVADHREAKSAAMTALQALEGVALSFAHLEVGDNRVEDRMIFERKTLLDLAGPIKHGRLFDIRSSARDFWRKVLDVCATSIDYDPSAEAPQRFFATVQNTMHWATHAP